MQFHAAKLDSVPAGTSASALPARIGPYEVLDTLGSGGMAQVFLVRRSGEAGFQRLYALKCLRSDLSTCPKSMEMFRDEAHIASRLHHNNVTSVVDVGRDGDRHYAVMDYVEGCTMLSMLRHSPSQRPARLLIPIILDLLHGLHAAHTLSSVEGEPLNLVHRDVSPSNVLLGTDGVARLADFGIAMTSLPRIDTDPNLFRGKLEFAAPEQLTCDAKRLDPRTDVFAVGAVMWSALTGEALFGGTTLDETMRNVLHADIQPPSRRLLQPPACLDRVCLKALKREKNKRYATALEMAEDLRAVALENNLLASREEVGQWVRKASATSLQRRRSLLREVHVGESGRVPVGRPPANDSWPLAMLGSESFSRSGDTGANTLEHANAIKRVSGMRPAPMRPGSRPEWLSKAPAWATPGTMWTAVIAACVSFAAVYTMASW